MILNIKEFFTFSFRIETGQEKWSKHERPYTTFTKASKESGEESEDGGGGWYKYVEKRKRENGSNLSKSTNKIKNHPDDYQG